MQLTDKPAESRAGKPRNYSGLLREINQRIRSAQYTALKAVNQELSRLYRDIGRMIVERQAVAGWGKAVVEPLAADLQAEFPGAGSFSASNLWRMKAFFEAYNGLKKFASLVREIAWSHNLVILERCKDPLQREFYANHSRMLTLNGTTVRCATSGSIGTCLNPLSRHRNQPLSGSGHTITNAPIWPWAAYHRYKRGSPFNLYF